MISQHINLFFQRVIILLCLGILSGCNLLSDDSDNFHFNATVNGEKWEAVPSGEWQDDGLLVYGQKEASGGTEYLWVKATEFNGEGVYSVYSGFSVFVGGDVVVFQAPAIDTTGIANILSYNQKSEITVVEGEFEFEGLANKNYLGFKLGDTITIKGKFRTKIDNLDSN